MQRENQWEAIYTLENITALMRKALFTIWIAQIKGVTELHTGFLGSGVYRGNRHLVLALYWVMSQIA